MPESGFSVTTHKAAVVLIAVAALVVIAVTVGLLAGGTPSSTPRSPSTTASTDQPTTVRASRAASLTALDPCTVLSADQAMKHGYIEYQRGDYGGDSCIYYPSEMQPTAGSTSLSIYFGDGLTSITPRSIDRVVAQQLRAYHAIRVEAADAPRCTLVIGITARESVNLSATRLTLDEACAQVQRVFEQIEPRLPVPRV